MELNMAVVVQTVLISVAFCLFVTYWILRKKHDYWKKRGIPYLKPGLLLGNLQFMGRKSVFDFFHELKEKFHEDYVGIFLSSQPGLVIQSPELCKTILVKDFEYFQNRYLYPGYSKQDPLGSLNIFCLKNPMWSEMRHKLTPMFTTARLKMIADLMNENAKQLVGKIQRDCIEKKQMISNKELFHMYTSETVASNVFGLRTSSLNDEYSPIWVITCHMLRWTFRRGMEFLMIFFLPKMAELLRLKFFSNAATQHLKKVFRSVVEERTKCGTLNSGQHKDLVNHLAKIKDLLNLPEGTTPEMADELMMGQVAVFIFGSVETSSSTLTYTIHELSYHPEIQEKVYEEVTQAFERSGNDVLSYDELIQLKYLSACVYETLRKYPVVPYLDRVCTKPYKLNDKITIEKGTPVFINLVAVQNDERNFENANQWDPDRMLTMTDNDCLDYKYMPFGVGPRYCIGKRYGMLQVRAALSQIIRRYRIERGPGSYNIKADPMSVMLAPDCGGIVNYVPR